MLPDGTHEHPSLGSNFHLKEIYGHLFDVTIESGRSMVDNKIELGRLKYFLVAKDTLKRVVCGKLSSNRLFPLDN